MKINDIYEVIINDEDDIGNGITRIDNFVVFIPYALKDEKMKIKIIKINKRFAIGRIEKIIKKSNRRECIKCNSFNECGGCSFLHLSFNEEKNKKIDFINKLFNFNIKEIISNNEYNYRNKATFHVNCGKIGYYSENTNDLVEFDNCILLDERINEVYNILKHMNLSGISKVIVRTTKYSIMIIFNGEKDFINYKELINKIKIDSLYLNDKLVYGNAYIIEELGNIKYSIYPNAFFQVNTDNMKIMYDKVKEYAGKGNKLLDLYCGTGTIGIYLKENFKEITGIEENKEAILNANINKNLNNLSDINFICGDASIAKNNNYDVIVVDPPRSGLSNKVINFLNKSNAKTIVYVSCNPKTLKRDLNLLDKYNMVKMECINMFNKTKHIECVCKFEYIK